MIGAFAAGLALGLVLGVAVAALLSVAGDGEESDEDPCRRCRIFSEELGVCHIWGCETSGGCIQFDRKE